ncbi:MAG TPA: hypothetical protein VNT32_15230 [Thermoleophilaceae bacterium]|nr:hypothetical protein [Thermoleophilaceae bacterium]
MRFGYHRRRVADTLAALKASRALAERERVSRAALEQYQRERVAAIVRYAAANSVFYRERFEGLVGAGPVDLAALPALDKRLMMDRYDDLVTDRRVRRDETLAWIEGLERDSLLHGRYRAMTTSGSSGRKGLFVYDEPGWRAIMAGFLRYNALVGIRPRLPRRMRIAAIVGESPYQMAPQVSSTFSIGIHRILRLPVTMPLDEMVAELNRFQPHIMNPYPSVGLLLAEQQLAGRLRISLDSMSVSSEICTPEMAERMQAAFGVRPFNLYASTEGAWGCECERHDGVHLFEDVCLVENVDEQNRPVPTGEPGARILVTNLHNLVQPIIRLELADVLTIDPEPCGCGRTLIRARAVEGRSDDVLRLPAQTGGTVAVMPGHFGVVTRDRGVAEFQVRQEGDVLRVRVVARPGADGGLGERLHAAVTEKLERLGAAAPEVVVERVAELPRANGGKLQMVVSDTRSPAHVPRAPV